MNKYDIDNEYLNRRFKYFPESGELIWLDGQMAGKDAGCVTIQKSGNAYKYLSIGVNGIQFNFKVHTIIWKIVTGSWPSGEIDHLDGNGLNNSLSNLRDVSRSVNNKNRRIQSNNRITKVSGVRFCDRKVPGWQVYSYCGETRKQIHLGYFDNFFDAVCRRKSYELHNGYTGRHGR